MASILPFRPCKTQQLADSLYAVRTAMVNFYLFDTGKRLIAFDTGLSSPMVSAGMKKLNLPPEKVEYVFLTHSDYDHTGGLRLFKNAIVYLSTLELPMINGEQARMLGLFHNRRLRKPTLLDDRKITRVDNTIVQILSAPGHTAGTACYWVNNKYLITGDVLRATPEGKITPFLMFQNMNHEEDKRSVEMLKREGFIDKAEMVLTGHTGVLLTNPCLDGWVKIGMTERNDDRKPLA